MSVKAMAESMVQSVRSYVEAACDPLHERIKALEAAVSELRKAIAEMQEPKP